MFKNKKAIVLVLSVIFISTMSVIAYAAANYESPAEAVSSITQRSLESVINERNETGKTYGEIAKDADVLSEFQAEMLEIKKEKLSAQVSEGIITQEEADEIIKAIENTMENCDGSGGNRLGKQNEACFGNRGNAVRRNGQNIDNELKGNGQGKVGKRMRNGSQLRLQNGSCGG